MQRRDSSSPGYLDKVQGFFVSIEALLKRCVGLFVQTLILGYNLEIDSIAFRAIMEGKN